MPLVSDRMMAGSISSSPVLRLLVVAVPGLLLAMVLGMQLGEGNLIVGVLVLVLSAGFLVAMALGRRGALEVAILGFLIFGYFVGNRGFAQLSAMQPLYIGEMGLGALVVMLGVRALVKRDFPKFRHPLMWLILAYLAYAVVRFSFDVRQYKMDAIRDLAVVYYAAFFFIAYQIGSRPTARRLLEKAIVVTAFAHAIVSLIYTVRPEWLQAHLFVRGTPLLIQKGDLTATFSAVALFIVLTRPGIFRFRWLRAGVLLVLVACIGLGASRAAILSAAVGCCFLWLARKREFFVYAAAGALVLLTTLLAANVFGDALKDVAAVAVFKDKLASMVDVTGEYRYETDFGMNKGHNNQFRTTFWKVMMNDTTETNPVFGKGFGYNFLPKFEAYYNRGGWEGLRSPHNYYVTVYGRMGIVGLLIFLAITVVIAKDAIRAAGEVRRGELSPGDFSFWCAAAVLLTSATFGVVLEGPMGAIPFWTFLGLAASSVALKRQEAPAKPRLVRAEPARKLELAAAQ